MDVVYLRYEVKQEFTINYYEYKAGEQINGWLNKDDHFLFKLPNDYIVNFYPLQRKKYLMPLSVGYKELKQDRFKGISY